MLEFALVCFTTFFATIGPVDVAALYATLTSRAARSRRRKMAIKAVLIAATLLILFVLADNEVLRLLGITLPALRTAGGILLLLMAIDMVFARASGATGTTDDEDAEAHHRKDISVFPLATPLLAGPGSLSAAILLTAEADGEPVATIIVACAIISVLAIALVMLLLAGELHRLLGVTGQNVIARIVGILLAALAVQFIFDGIKAGQIISP